MCGPAESMAVTVTTAVLVEQTQTNQVDNQTHCANPQDHLRVVDGLRLVEPLQALNSDGEAESHEEDGVDQSSQHLSSSPAEGVLGPGLWRHPHTDEGDDEGRDI